MSDTPRDPAEYQTVEECVRDERWVWDVSFYFNPDRGWFVFADRLSRDDALTVITGPHDTILAAAQAALAQAQDT